MLGLSYSLMSRAALGGVPATPSIVLSALSLTENSAEGTAVGNLSVSSGTGTYTFSLTDSAGTRFKVAGTNGVNLQAGSTASNYEAAASYDITIHADNGAGSVLDRTVTIAIVNVLEVTLSALTLNTDEILEGDPEDTVVGALQSVSSGSSLSLTDTAGGRFKLSGSNIVAGATATDFGTATSHNITVRETHVDGSNSPRDSVIAITVLEDTVLATPTLTWVSAPNVNVPIFEAAVPIGVMVAGDDWVIELDDNALFSSPTEITDTVGAPDASDGDIDADSGVTLPDGLAYARFRVLRDAVPITNWSVIISETIDAPPAMTSLATFNVTEGDTAVATLTATQASTFAVGGTDAAFFQVIGNALSFISAPDWDAPADAGADNEYNITITPTATHDSEAGSPQSIVVQVEPIGDYAETTAYLARSVTSGGTVSSRLNVTHLNAVKAFINGLVSDNIWNNFDAIYLLATQAIGADNKDILRMNLVQNAYNLTGTGGTFVADRGWTDAGGTTPHLTNFTPSTAPTPKWALNDAHLAIWSNTITSARGEMGWSNGGPISGIGINTTGANIGFNQAAFTTNLAGPTVAGFFLGQRKAASGAGALETFYAAKNAGTVSAGATGSTVSTSLTTGNLNVGAIAGSSYSGDQISFASIGKSMSAGDIEKLYDRIQTYMTAIGNT